MTNTTTRPASWTVRASGRGGRAAHLAHGIAAVCGTDLGAGHLREVCPGDRLCRRCQAWAGRHPELVAPEVAEVEPVTEAPALVGNPRPSLLCPECPDPRCVPNHHDAGQPCGCVPLPAAPAAEVEPCRVKRCDAPATHAVTWAKSSPIDPRPFTAHYCGAHAEQKSDGGTSATVAALPDAGAGVAEVQATVGDTSPEAAAGHTPATLAGALEAALEASLAGGVCGVSMVAGVPAVDLGVPYGHVWEFPTARGHAARMAELGRPVARVLPDGPGASQDGVTAARTDATPDAGQPGACPLCGGPEGAVCDSAPRPATVEGFDAAVSAEVNARLEASPWSWSEVAAALGMPALRFAREADGAEPFTASELHAVARHLGTSASEVVAAVEARLGGAPASAHGRR